MELQISMTITDLVSCAVPGRKTSGNISLYRRRECLMNGDDPRGVHPSESAATGNGAMAVYFDGGNSPCRLHQEMVCVTVWLKQLLKLWQLIVWNSSFSETFDIPILDQENKETRDWIIHSFWADLVVHTYVQRYSVYYFYYIKFILV